jgi:hypothetical protein
LTRRFPEKAMIVENDAKSPLDVRVGTAANYMEQGDGS